MSGEKIESGSVGPFEEMRGINDRFKAAPGPVLPSAGPVAESFGRVVAGLQGDTDLALEAVRAFDAIPSLTERRARFVYEGARIAAMAAGAPIVPVSWEEREEPFRKQFLNVIERQCGEQRSRSPEELHGSWMQSYFAMGWIYGPQYSRENKVHPDLVPYAELGRLERDKDAVFVALCEIARQWIYDVPAGEEEGDHA